MSVPVDPHLDLAKFVGAASAPVALIIATAIIVSNLGGRYALLAGFFRGATAELRDLGERGPRVEAALHKERAILKRRMHLLTVATTWLLATIIMFTMTVMFTGVAILFPKSSLAIAMVVLFSFAGAAMLVVAVVIGITENIVSRLSTELN